MDVLILMWNRSEVGCPSGFAGVCAKLAQTLSRRQRKRRRRREDREEKMKVIYHLNGKKA